MCVYISNCIGSFAELGDVSNLSNSFFLSFSVTLIFHCLSSPKLSIAKLQTRRYLQKSLNKLLKFTDFSTIDHILCHLPLPSFVQYYHFFDSSSYPRLMYPEFKSFPLMGVLSNISEQLVLSDNRKLLAKPMLESNDIHLCLRDYDYKTEEKEDEYKLTLKLESPPKPETFIKNGSVDDNNKDRSRDQDQEEDGFKTPTSTGQKIPCVLKCPPAPMKPKSRPIMKVIKRKGVQYYHQDRRIALQDLSNEIEALFPPALRADFGNKIKKVRPELSSTTTTTDENRVIPDPLCMDQKPI